MMNSGAARAFDLSEEPDTVRSAYGRGTFGQGCLIAPPGRTGGGVRRGDARRIRRRFKLGHARRPTSRWSSSFRKKLDRGWSALLGDLKEHGMLETTTVLWLGEFGRTPKINGNAGRDHFPAAWSCVFAGGGIRGGQAHGKTSPDGMSVAGGKVDVGDVLATLSQSLGVAPRRKTSRRWGVPSKSRREPPFAESWRRQGRRAVRQVVLCVVLAVLPAAAVVGGEADGPKAGKAAANAVLLRSVRPVFVRLRVEVDGQSLARFRERAVSQWFRQLDGNHDGFLQKSELGPFEKGLSDDPTAGPPLKWDRFDTSPADGKLSPAEFRAYVERRLGPPLVLSVRSETSSEVDASLFEHLDQNGDGV